MTDESSKRQSARTGAAPASSDIRFNFSCPTCGSVLEAVASHAESPGRCPTCAAVFKIPQVDRRTGLAMRATASESELQDPTPVHAYAAAGEKAPTIVDLSEGNRGICCPRCQAVSDIENNFCTICGFPFTMDGANRAAAPTTDARSVFSFALGLISLPLCLCAGPIGGLVALAAGVLGWSSLTRITATSRTRGRKGWAVAGLVFAGIGLTITIMQILVVF